jgi:hypothetical protein
VDYQETYASELIRLRMAMLAVVPEAAKEETPVSLHNPGNSGGITEISYEFHQMIALYRIKLRGLGQLTGPLTQDEIIQLNDRHIAPKQP